MSRRAAIQALCKAHGIDVLFIESICDREDVIMQNIREVKLSSPDYVGWDADAAVADFMARIRFYEKGYETLSVDEMDAEISFVKLINVNEQVIVNRVRGYLQSRIVALLMNLNIGHANIYLSRHGESQLNLEGRIGGDSLLSPRGERYMRALPELIAQAQAYTPYGHADDDRERSRGADGDADADADADAVREPESLTVWTSTLRRTRQTASLLPYPKIAWRELDELSVGACDGMTYAEIEQRFPAEFAERDNDKYNYRYHGPGGESYADLVRRLEPVIMELERHRHDPNKAILIIGHQAVLRCIYGYLLSFSHDELPYIPIPLHMVMRITPKAYGCVETRFRVDIPAVNTYRARKAPNLALPTSGGG
ncbi:bifunctional 6-phosphofructo-2-kinase/fructose-2,6-bisphosphate 2-phosphatase, partial [Caulochytrium protostelioides]